MASYWLSSLRASYLVNELCEEVAPLKISNISVENLISIVSARLVSRLG